MDENKIDISKLSSIKQKMLELPDDILTVSINIAISLQNNKNLTEMSLKNIIPEPIMLDKRNIIASEQELSAKAKNEYLENANELFNSSSSTQNEVKVKYITDEQNTNTQELPPVKKSSLFDKAKSFTQSYLSKGLAGNKAEGPIKSLRVLSCHGNSDLPPCPHRMNSEKFKDSYYCGACGCGDRGPTQLINLIGEDGKTQYSKLDFPKVVCPLSMPGFSNYEKWKEEDQNPRKNVIESMFSVEYIMNNSNLMNEKESEENEDSSDDQTQQENS